MADYLIATTPELITWCIGIVLAIIMIKRGGARAEKLFLSGCIIMLIVAVISGFIPWFYKQQIGGLILGAREIGIIVSIVSGIPGLAGFVCLVVAFWLRFRMKRVEAD